MAKIWMFINILLFFYSALYLPYKISFVEDGGYGVQIFETIINIIFALDMVVCSVTAYYNNGDMIDDVKVIFKEYFTTWFFVDLLSVFPFEIFFYFSTTFGNFTKLL